MEVWADQLPVEATKELRRLQGSQVAGKRRQIDDLINSLVPRSVGYSTREAPTFYIDNFKQCILKTKESFARRENVGVTRPEAIERCGGSVQVLEPGLM